METKSFMKKSLANKSVVERVVDQITNAIINGELLPGDKLPTEPELCETFNVGRNSVREAIKILEVISNPVRNHFAKRFQTSDRRIAKSNRCRSFTGSNAEDGG